MRHGSLHRVVPAPVGKTVGRDVDDAHHERPAQITTGMRQFEPSGAELPVGGGRRQIHMSDGTPSMNQEASRPNSTSSCGRFAA